MNTRFRSRWDFVGNSLKISWQYLWQSLLPHLLPHFLMKKNRWNFVKDFVVSTQIWRNVDNFLTKFWRFFFVAKCCGKTVCHKQNFVKTLGFDEIFLVAKGVATTFCHKKKSLRFRQRFRRFNSCSSEMLTKSWRNSDERKTMGLDARSPYTKTHCKWQDIMEE